MRCPKCYCKVDKATNKCVHCGFNVSTLKDATNAKAKEKFRSGDGDLVLYTRTLPQDLNKKTLLLLSGFLGVYGAHYFYVGKMLRGLLNLIVGLFGTVFIIFAMLNFEGGIVFKIFNYVFDVLFALDLILSISDFINIIFNRFKVPVAF